MSMPNRKWQGTEGGYRFGFNGQERDKEISEDTYTAEFWEYSANLGRRWNIDPLTFDFPWQSPYCTFDNSPIAMNDPLGLSSEWHIETKGEGNTKKTYLVADKGDNIGTLLSFLANYNLGKENTEKIIAKGKNYLNDNGGDSDRDFKGNSKFDLTEILKIQIHVGRTWGYKGHRQLYDKVGGHVGIEMSKMVYHYYYRHRHPTDEIFASTPGGVWETRRNVYLGKEKGPRSDGTHRGIDYVDSNGKLHGDDAYFKVPLSIGQYSNLRTTLDGYTADPYNVPNYGLFLRRYLFFGAKQRRCTSMAYSFLKESGIDLGMGAMWRIHTFTPHSFYHYLKMHYTPHHIAFGRKGDNNNYIKKD